MRQGVVTARRNLEGVLLYFVTQLAMWMSKPEFDAISVGDAEDEEEQRGHNQNHSMMDVQKPDTGGESASSSRIRANEDING